jgi:hypothetical protein
MKKLVAILMVAAVIGAVAWAQENVGDDNPQTSLPEVSALIRNGLNKNYDSILQKSSGLSDQQRLYLYDRNSKTAGLPAVLNGLVGFGIGSYIQRDMVGGIVGSVGDGLGIILMISSADYFKKTGWSLSSSDFTDKNGLYDNDKYQAALKSAQKKSQDALETATALIVTGSVILTASRVFGIIKAYTFTNSYNRTLKDALNYYGMSFNIAPSFDMDGNGKVAAAVSFKL